MIGYQIEASEPLIRGHQGWAAVLSSGNMVLEGYPVRPERDGLSAWQTLLSEVEQDPIAYIKIVAVTRGTTTIWSPIYHPQDSAGLVDGLVSMYRQSRALQPNSKPHIEQAVGHIREDLGLVFVTLVSMDGHSVRSTVDKLDQLWVHSTLRLTRDILFQRSL